MQVTDIQNLILQELRGLFTGTHQDLFTQYIAKNAAVTPAVMTMEGCQELGVDEETTRRLAALAMLLNSWADLTDDLIDLDKDIRPNAESLLFQCIFEVQMWLWAEANFPNSPKVLLPYIAVMFRGQWDEKRLETFTWQDYVQVCHNKSGLQLAVLGYLPIFLLPEFQDETLQEEIIEVGKFYGLLVQLHQDLVDEESIFWQCGASETEVYSYLSAENQRLMQFRVPARLQNRVAMLLTEMWNGSLRELYK